MPGPGRPWLLSSASAARWVPGSMRNSYSPRRVWLYPCQRALAQDFEPPVVGSA